MTRFANGLPIEPFLPGEVNPYITGVIHYNWNELETLYKTFQKMDNDIRFSKPEISSLGFVTCVYYPGPRKFTCSLSAPRANRQTVERGYYVLWNDTLSHDTIRDSSYEDLLHDLRKIYGVVIKSANVCSTSVGRPNGHEQAEATQIVQMIRKWWLTN